MDYAGIEFHFKLPEEVAGGVYKLRANAERVEVLRFFVLRGEAR